MWLAGLALTFAVLGCLAVIALLMHPIFRGEEAE